MPQITSQIQAQLISELQENTNSTDNRAGTIEQN